MCVFLGVYMRKDKFHRGKLLSVGGQVFHNASGGVWLWGSGCVCACSGHCTQGVSWGLICWIPFLLKPIDPTGRVTSHEAVVWVCACTFACVVWPDLVDKMLSFPQTLSLIIETRGSEIHICPYSRGKTRWALTYTHNVYKVSRKQRSLTWSASRWK